MMLYISISLGYKVLYNKRHAGIEGSYIEGKEDFYSCHFVGSLLKLWLQLFLHVNSDYIIVHCTIVIVYSVLYSYTIHYNYMTMM